MMENFLTIVGAFTLLVGMCVLGAYPTKWIVNYLFTPGVLVALFGTVSLGVWQAMALNFISATLFKGSYSTSKAK